MARLTHAGRGAGARDHGGQPPVGLLIGLLVLVSPLVADAQQSQQCHTNADGTTTCIGGGGGGAGGTCPNGHCGGGNHRFSVTDTPISDLIKDPEAKAVLEKALPPISQYYDQIGSMTLSQVAPMSQGAIDDAKLKEIQQALDALPN